MVDFLSAPWLDELDRAVRTVATPFDPPTVVEIVVTDDSAQSGEAECQVRYHLVLDQEGGRVVAGSHSQPDVRFVFDRESAIRIATGEEYPQQAIAAGRCHLEGNPELLGRVAEALLLLPPATASLRPERDDKP